MNRIWSILSKQEDRKIEIEKLKEVLLQNKFPT